MKTKHIFLVILICFLLTLICAGNCFAKINCKKIASYKKLKSSGACVEGKEQAHHLIEKRFAECLGVNENLIPSVCIPIEQHKLYTNIWREEIPYREKYTSCVMAVMLALIKIYKDDPCVISELTKYLSKTQIKRLARLSLVIAKHPLTLRSLTLVSSVVLAYEVYDVFSSLDQDFHEDEYIRKSFDFSLVSIELNEKGDEENAKKKLGESYFFLGYACFRKMVRYRTDYHKEIADRFSGQSNLLEEKAAHFFEQSVNRNDTIPYGFFYLGELCLRQNSLQEAQLNFDKAAKLFRLENNQEFLEMTTKRLKEIEDRRTSDEKK